MYQIVRITVIKQTKTKDIIMLYLSKGTYWASIFNFGSEVSTSSGLQYKLIGYI